jgi:DNA-binding response OmpR family regulator
MKMSAMISAGESAVALDREQMNSPQRILVVDDEADARQLTVDVLVQSGYDVDAVEDGAAGLAALVAGKYDLIITDNKMPRMSGVEMIEKLRSARRGLPVVMVTGYLPTHEFVRRPWLKPDVILEKPFSNDDLLAAVKKFLSATDAVSKSSRLFKDCAMDDNKTPQARERAGASIRDQTNLHQRILVVDDDRDSRQLSMDVLTAFGYDVEGAKDGAAGWEALQNGSYNLVITDNKMPRMTGIEMIEKLRSARMTLPVIMATRYLPTHEFVRRPWLKPDAALERPFSGDDLLATVKKTLRADGGNDDRSETLLPKYL